MTDGVDRLAESLRFVSAQLDLTEGFRRCGVVRRVGDGVAEAFPFGCHEQQLFDQLVVAPGEIQTTGFLLGNDAALVQLHRPGNRTSR